MAFPTIQDLKELTVFLNALKVSWAYSGSLAMYIHGSILRDPRADESRFPNDVDILTDSVPAVSFALAGRIHNANLNNPPGTQSLKCRITNAVQVTQENGARAYWNIDVVRSDKGFGSLSNSIIYSWGDQGHPIVSLQSLISSKEVIIKDEDLEDYHDSAKTDLNYLIGLQG